MSLLLVCTTDSYIKFTYSGAEVGKAKVSAGTCALSGTLVGVANWTTTTDPNNYVDNNKVVLQLSFTATGYDSSGSAPDGTASFTITGDTTYTTCNNSKPIRKTNNASGTTTQHSIEYPYPIINWTSTLVATIDDTVQTSTSCD